MISVSFSPTKLLHAAAKYLLAAGGIAVCLIAAFGTCGGVCDRFNLRDLVGSHPLLTLPTGAGFALTGAALALLAARCGKASALCSLLAAPLSAISLYESFLSPAAESHSGWLFKGDPDPVTSLSLAFSALAAFMLCPGSGRRCLGCPDPFEIPAAHDLSGRPPPPRTSVCDLIAVFLASVVLAFGSLALVSRFAGIETALSWQSADMALPAAIAATVTGLSVIAYLWGMSKSLPLWLSIPFGIGFIAITLSLVHAVQRYEDSRFHQNIKIETKFLATQIDLHLSDLFLSLDRMADRWGTLESYAERTWKRDAEAELKAYPFVMAIEWVGTDSTLRWIIPETGNEKLFGIKLNAEGERAAVVAKAMETNAPQITGVVPLIQGGNGFLRFIPLHVNGRFDGMMVCVISPELLMEHITALHVAQRHNVTLRDGRDTLYTTVPARGDIDRSLLDAWGHTIKLDMPEHDWTLTVTPSPKALTEKNSLLPLLVLGAGLAISLAAAFLIFLTLKWRSMSSMLREHGDRLRSIMNNTVEGIITINERGIIETFNPACEAMFGLSAQDAVGNNVSILMPEPHAKQHDDHINRYLTTGEARIIGKGREVEGRRKDGSVFPLDLSVSRFESQGKIMFCGILRDISQRKHFQRLQEEFTAIASHELRTPLTCLRGAIGLLATSQLKFMQERESGLLQIALRNAERLTSIVNDILDTEKIKSGKLPLKLEPIDVPSFLEQALDDNSPISEALNIPFVLVGEVPDTKVLADRDRLLQIFSNLLSNAAKFSHSGSEVQVSAESDSDCVKFMVRDFGIGIPEEFRPHIFSKFAQSSDSRRNGIEGSGLGLLITKALVENMGGTLGYSSEPGKGTTFVFDLPCADRDMPLPTEA